MVHLNLPRLDNDLDEWQPWMPCSDFGPSKRDAPPSRMPSHSISSFGILHMIHVVLSHRLWDAPEHSSQSGDVFLRALQNAVNHCGAQASLSNCVLTGEALTGQLPSVHLLRVAFLCAASMHKGFTHLHRAVLICIESYMNNFGLCGLPPLLAVFMQIIDQQVQGNSLTEEERDRWKQIEMTIGSVWIEPIRNCDPGTRVEGIHSAHYSRPSDTTFGPIPDMRSQQPSTATPFHPITEITHGSTNISIPFSHDPNSKMSELGAHQPHPETARLHLNAPSSTIGDFEDINTLAISPSMHFSGSRRPDFTGAALDHDTILDDIASFERTSVPELDTQFMANLGLRPGTNLADVFSLEFMGFP
ncbi:hypothetical protein NUW58_g4831 [Xylaria curta]|uniref:Uncharacterized protein n=1 Tax=Xylaria curta TaxID=42375 RepID=A0ACC1P4Q7_9PEZI|nr:hypothetical protein NUW58_g4831 [Xylaria curta]